MKFISPRLVSFFLAVYASLASTPPMFCAEPAPKAGAERQPSTDRGWPRKFTSGASSFSVYQPQIEQ
jgi:hypothetical protein